MGRGGREKTKGKDPRDVPIVSALSKGKGACEGLSRGWPAKTKTNPADA